MARWCVFVVFLTLLINLTNFCFSASNESDDWWKTAVIYQIYPRSFKDSDGDGIGDINGIISKLDHIANTGIDAIWLSPLFKSPMFDFGYDVSDYKKIDPIFGTIEDFDNLRKVTKQKGIKLLLDFVPNHSSEKHEWFQKSAMNDTKYIDYYIWANGRVLNDTYERLPPNNWLSKFGGSAWTWNEDRGQYYLHKYLSEQPDLNYRNPNVSMEMKDVLTYWLEKGVDGFRIDAVSSLFEDKNLTFENRSDDMNAKPGNYKSLNHSSTINQPENHVLIAEWRKLVDEYSKKDGKTRILIVQSSGDFSEVTAYFGSKNNPEAHFPFNFGLISGISNESNAQDIKRIIETWSSVETKNWVIGTHDDHRVASRLGKEMVDIMNMLVLLLPGTAVTYYGEEIGMEDTPIKWENIKDSACLSTGRKKHALLCRDFERTPFQWDNTENAGFSTSIGKIWLPVNSQYNEVNLKNQMDSDRSIYKTYKRLIEARKEPAVQSGSLNITVPNDNILTFSRDLEGHKSFVVIMNLGKTQLPIDLSMYNALKGNVTVYASSLNSSFTIGSTLDATTTVTLNPKEAIVIVASSTLSTSENYRSKSSSLYIDSTILLLVTIFLALSGNVLST